MLLSKTHRDSFHKTFSKGFIRYAKVVRIDEEEKVLDESLVEMLFRGAQFVISGGVESMQQISVLIDEGRHHFKLMTEKYEISPELEHYGCMVDLLSRAGIVDVAIELVKNMPIFPDPVLWVIILGTCTTRGLLGQCEKLVLPPSHIKCPY
ncbi:pentatricopeptide repeat-containing protein [Tanacetum coccineum]